MREVFLENRPARSNCAITVEELNTSDDEASGDTEPIDWRLPKNENGGCEPVLVDGGKTVILERRVLCLFSQHNWFRRLCISANFKSIDGTNTYFDLFVLLVIGANSITLAMYDYRDPTDQTTWNSNIGLASDVFTWLFIVEATVKIMTFGFVSAQNSYLREYANIFDFFITVSGLVEFCVKVTSVDGVQSASTSWISALRVLRVLRPLRSINAMPSMREQVNVIITCLPELANVGIFLSFVLFLFAIIGVQEFSGATYARCRTTDKPVNSTHWPKSTEFTNICAKSNGMFKCPKDLYCGHPAEYNISLADDGVYEDS